ncbi:hypothetical protein C5Y96_26920 [Blastopirellula marina]|uniref:Uncharacterized protein n=1 Tax=Blastopirellula marina TaxID=124 RepID=A0A2S8EZR7_9BACT|nr:MULTISPECIES: hypothetical protein [Pirellulaceae]PQO25134.1 hypothetical protein C5Y96_26920 [Blastopirellula marina]RCS40985.1 hypothetical protein DTL36_26965 [Bremerella cremea]
MNASETPATETPSPVRRNRWTSFSLLTILLLLTIVALSISHVRMSWQMDENNQAMATMEAELTQLRKEAGYLEITDEKLVHVVAPPTHEDLVWRWKVFVPQGVVMKSHMQTKRSTGSSMTTTSQLDEGENLVELAIYRGPEGEWKQKITVIRGHDTSSSSVDLPEDFMSWLNNASTGSSGIMRSSGTTTFQPDEDITLLKMTARGREKPDPNTGAPGKDLEAFTEITAWLEPEASTSNE